MEKHEQKEKPKKIWHSKLYIMLKNDDDRWRDWGGYFTNH
jgi:hypothetical protein